MAAGLLGAFKAQEDPAINPDTRGKIRVLVVGSSGAWSAGRGAGAEVPAPIWGRPAGGRGGRGSPRVHPRARGHAGGSDAGARAEPPPSPPPPPPPGCGKSSLAHLIATGTPAPAHIATTVGGAVLLRLLTYPLERAKAQQTGPLANQEFFVELWDVAAAERYEPMRPLYYAGINGVLLVHDLSAPRSLPSLQRWAAEVTQRGAFSAPYSEERAALNVGGLPVPVMGEKGG